MSSISTLVDRVKITVTSTGTGPFVLGAPVPSFRGEEALLDGATYSYVAASAFSYEAGTGVYNASTHRLVRSPVISSNGGSAVAFPANVELAFTALAQDLIATGGTLPIVDSLGSSTTDAISQSAATNGINAITTALMASAGANAIGWVMAGAGAVARTVQSKLRDVVSVKDFGAAGDGSTDDTAAFTAAVAAINTAGGGALFVPDGTYIISSTVVLPWNLYNFRLYGAGRRSIIKAKTGLAAFDLINWAPPSATYAYHEISDLAFDGSGLTGNGNLINTNGLGGTRMLRLYLTSISTTGSGIQTIGKGATYVHDLLIDDIYIDTLTGGSGIKVGGTTADSVVRGIKVQGRGVLDYGIYCATGASHVRFDDCHPYNCDIAQISVNGNGDALWFTNCTTDAGNASTYNFYANQMTNCTFTSCQFTFSLGNIDLVTLIDCTDNNFSNSNFLGNPSTRWGVNESGASNRNVFQQCIFQGTFSSGRATLVGAASSISKFGKESIVGGNINVTSGTTRYGGFGGPGSATEGDVQFIVPYDGTLRKLKVGATNAPGASQSFVCTVRVNGADQALTATMSGASAFSATGLASIAVSEGDVVSIKAVSSAGAAASTIHITLTIPH